MILKKTNGLMILILINDIKMLKDPKSKKLGVDHCGITLDPTVTGVTG